MSHTPGPWRHEKDGDEPYWAVNLPMQDGSGRCGYANIMVYTNESDARLVAAAPAMLSALRVAHDALDFAQAQVDSENDARQLRKWGLQIGRVIQLAEGVSDDER